MARMKEFATDVSEAMGLGGEITDEVLRIGNTILFVVMQRETVADAARRTGASRSRLNAAITRGLLECVPGVVLVERTLNKAAVDTYLKRGK